MTCLGTEKRHGASKPARSVVDERDDETFAAGLVETRTKPLPGAFPALLVSAWSASAHSI